jgi:hypothetical protein
VNKIYISGWVKSSSGASSIKVENTVLSYNNSGAAFLAKYRRSGELEWAKLLYDAPTSYPVGELELNARNGLYLLERQTTTSGLFLKKFDSAGDVVLSQQLTTDNVIRPTFAMGTDGTPHIAFSVFKNPSTVAGLTFTNRGPVLIKLAEPLGLPPLEIQQNRGGQMRLTWPSSVADVSLESTTALGGNWSRVDADARPVGSRKELDVTITTEAKFYRLRPAQ